MYALEAVDQVENLVLLQVGVLFAKPQSLHGGRMRIKVRMFRRREWRSRIQGEEREVANVLVAGGDKSGRVCECFGVDEM